MKNLLLAASTFAALFIAINTDAKETLKTIMPKPLHGFSVTPRATQLGYYVVPSKGKEGNETSAPSQPAIQQSAQLSFIENKGQIIDQNGKHRNDIDYKLDAGGMVMFIGDAQLHYQWSRTDNSKAKIQKSKTDHQASRAENYRMDVTLLGANKNAQVVVDEPQAYYESYYLSQCPKGTIAHSYSKITYKNVYPNIDWVIYVSNKSGGINASALGDGGSLKYDFIVRQGGDPANIKLQYNGATSLTLKDGALTAVTPFGSITEQAPYSYYADRKEKVNSSFKLNGNILSYDVSKSRGSILVIDPQLLWATYYYQANFSGSRTVDGTRSSAVATDRSYNVYMQGQGGNSNMATSGAIRSTTDGCSAFVVKFDKTGQRLWGTFYGDGVAEDNAYGAVCDSRGNVYVCGFFIGSDSNLITTPGAFNRKMGGGYVTKFGPDGSLKWGLLWNGESCCLWTL